MIQLDKLDFESIKKIVKFKDENFTNVKILVAGGININNVEEYVKCGINGVVTSSVYNCGMANISSRLKIL